MPKLRRVAFRILLALSIAGGLAIVVTLSIGLSALSSGPNYDGYNLLLIAMQALPFLAAVVVVTVILASIGTRVRFAVGGLTLASGVIGGAGLGLAALGSSLAGIDPRNQPVDLNSLLLAVWGVGTQLAPVAITLFAGAAALAAGTQIARRVTATPGRLPVAVA